MSFRAINRALVMLLIVTSAVQAQRQGAPSDALPGRVVDVDAGEFFLRAPDSIPAGLTTFRLHQVGLVRRRVSAGGAARDSMTLDRGDQTRGFHMLWVVRLDEGKTVAEFYRAAQAGERQPWARSLGGPGFVMPPATTNATLVLEPGNYVLVCHVGSARDDRSRQHLRHGMFRALTVVASRAPVARIPVADVIVRISAQGKLHFSVPLVAGRRVVRVENAGDRDYEFQVRRVLPGHSVAEAIAWRRRDGPLTVPPFEPAGGLSDVPAGGSLTTTMTFAAGDHFVGAAARVPFVVARRR